LIDKQKILLQESLDIEKLSDRASES